MCKNSISHLKFPENRKIPRMEYHQICSFLAAATSTLCSARCCIRAAIHLIALIKMNKLTAIVSYWDFTQLLLVRGPERMHNTATGMPFSSVSHWLIKYMHWQQRTAICAISPSTHPPRVKMSCVNGQMTEVQAEQLCKWERGWSQCLHGNHSYLNICLSEPNIQPRQEKKVDEEIKAARGHGARSWKCNLISRVPHMTLCSVHFHIHALRASIVAALHSSVP